MVSLCTLVFFVAISQHTIAAVKTISSPARLAFWGTLPPETFTLNPMSPDANLLTPAMARWIMIKMSYPPIDNSSQYLATPTVSHLISGVDFARDYEDSSHVQEELIMALESLAGRGQSMDYRWAGVSPLHHAISIGNAELVKVVLDAGADPYQTVKGSYVQALNGMDAFELLESLNATSPELYEASGELIRNHLAAAARSGQ